MPPFSLQDPLGTAIFEENANTESTSVIELEYGTMSSKLDDASYEPSALMAGIMCQTVGLHLVE
jgi:hypothetical protein